MWEICITAANATAEMAYLEHATPEMRKEYFEKKRLREIQETEERRHRELCDALRSRHYSQCDSPSGGSSDLPLGLLIGYGIGSIFK